MSARLRARPRTDQGKHAGPNTKSGSLARAGILLTWILDVAVHWIHGWISRGKAKAKDYEPSKAVEAGDLEGLPGPAAGSSKAGGAREDKPRLVKSGLLTAIAIALHNFPEGLATFIS